MFVKCAGGCGRMVRDENAVCGEMKCLEKVFFAPPPPPISTHKAFAHFKSKLVAAVAVPKEK